jgi:hypothetical protein
MPGPDQDRAARKIVWIEGQSRAGWGCSECRWVFTSPGPPVGETLEEMIRNFQMQMDAEFAAHDCAEHTRVKGTALSA